MKFYKLASVLAATALSASLLAACGNNDEETPKEDAKAEETTDEKNEEAVTGASISAEPADLVNALKADGSWIFAATADITVDEEITVDGDFHDKDDESADLYRKLALYTQDDDRNVTAEFTLTVPKMTVNSPNFRIQQGTVKGDIVVNAEGFELTNSTVDGNVTFASQELMDSAKLDEGTVTGEVTVAE